MLLLVKIIILTGNFPPFNQTPEVTVQAGFLDDNIHREIQFKCDIPNPGLIPSDLTVEVRWYVGEAHRRLGPFRINTTTLPHILHEADWAHYGLPLGLNVCCANIFYRSKPSKHSCMHCNIYSCVFETQV